MLMQAYVDVLRTALRNAPVIVQWRVSGIRADTRQSKFSISSYKWELGLIIYGS